MTCRFRRILAVCDDSVGSDDVLIRAIVVARASGARLTVAKTLVDHPGSTAAIEEIRKNLSRIVPWIIQEGVCNVTTDVLVGPTDIEVCRYVVQRRHDLVIAGADVGRRKRGLFRGNPAISLMRRCPCPVWIIKQGQSSQTPVLAAVDASADREATPIDVEILESAAALAEVHDVGLHVVHSWDVPNHESDRLKSGVSDSARQAILDEWETKHRDALEKLLAPYRNSCLRVTSHLPRGDPPIEIARLASTLDAGLVVMGATCRFGILGLVMGSPEGTVLSAAPYSVLAVKSNHFRTPNANLRVASETKLIMGAES